MYGLFVQDDWNVTESLLLSAGARYDWYELDDNLDQNFESSDFSPNISADYRFNNRLSIFAGYAEAFRGQQIKENFVLGDKNNSADRRPERAKNFEYGVKFANDMFRASVAVLTAQSMMLSYMITATVHILMAENLRPQASLQMLV